jgi:hypothetical protein
VSELVREREALALDRVIPVDEEKRTPAALVEEPSDIGSEGRDAHGYAPDVLDGVEDVDWRVEA